MSGGKSAPDFPSEETSLANPISYFRQFTGGYPSNADMWWAFKRPAEVGTDRPPKTYLEVMDPSLRHQIHTGNSPAPKGHFILNALHQDRSAMSGVGNIPVQTAGAYRPSSTAFFAGRVFYGGVNTPGFNTKIYFTQILERDRQIGECYQANDPTSEALRDLMPSDGGVIVIPEMAEVIHMHTMGMSLFVFCTNGIWQIAGGEGGFQANDYSVGKVSGTPALSNLSFVSAEGAPVWWNRTGIYTLVMDERGGAQVQSLTDETIKSFFLGIPEANKYYAKGSYNPQTQIIQWLYRSTPATSDQENYEYDFLLNLDTRSGAWYPWSLNTGENLNVKGLFAAQGWGTGEVQLSVQHGADQVFVGDDEVLSPLYKRTPVQNRFKYIVDVQGSLSGLTFAEEYRTDYRDWFDATGQDRPFKSHFVSGYSILGEGQKKFQNNYITVNYENLSNGGAYLQGVWDYSLDGVTGRWGQKQQIHGYKPNHEHRSRKLKLRGHGKVLQIRVSSEDYHPFVINGWSCSVSGNNSV